MTTYSTAPPEQLPAVEQPTETFASEQVLDALPLLDGRQAARAIAPQLALRGHYLALADGGETRLLRIERDITHLGRDATADIRFEDHRVSRDHAILVRHSGRLRLLDNRSANGTFVNDRRIVATNVSSGDVIDLGPVRMQLLEVP
jgi:pSer/pThr/pTyr-binding forkhead associated (FHA) protein